MDGPTRITSYDIPGGADVTGLNDGALYATASLYPSTISRFSYNGSHRLTRADFPGGAWITYTWDGNNIDSKTENGSSNVTLFNWQDMVGLTGITASSGLSESYEYDSHNRPWKVIDTDGNTVSVTHYHLQNDL